MKVTNRRIWKTDSGNTLFTMDDGDQQGVWDTIQGFLTAEELCDLALAARDVKAVLETAGYHNAMVDEIGA